MMVGPLVIAAASGITAAAVFYWLTPRLPQARAGWYQMVLGGILVAFVASISGWGVLRVAALHCGTYDLGVYDQVVWNTSKGRLFEISVAGPVTNYLGFHFSPVLALLVPIYWITPDAWVLMTMQAIGIALAALPIAWLARERLGSRLAAVVFVLAYSLFPSIQKIARYDVHSVAFAMPLLFFATYFMLKRRYLPFAIALALALLCKEDIGLTVAAIGVFLFLVHKRRWAGAALAVLGVAWTFVAIRWVIPAFRGGEEYLYVSRYSYLGGSVDEILTTLLTRPLYVLEHLFVPGKLAFALYMLVPLGFLPLIGFEVFALALPTFGYLLLSDSPVQYSIHYQYPAPLIPFIFLGAVIGVGRLAAWWAKRHGDSPDTRRRMVMAGVGFVAAAGVLNAVFYSPPWLANLPGLLEDLPRGASARQGVVEIPSQAIVMAQSNLVPLVNHRRYIYTFPDVPDLGAVDYILLDREGAISPLPSHETLFRAIERFQRNPFLEPFYQEGGFLFFRKKPGQIPNPIGANFDHAMTLLGYDLGSRPTEAGQAVPVTLYWQSRGRLTRRYSVYLHLLDGAGERWALTDQEPGQGRYPTVDWLPGETLHETYTLTVPIGTPPGNYALTVGLRDMASSQQVDVLDAAGRPQGPGVALSVSIVRPARPLDPGAMAIPHRLDRALGDDLLLLGYDLDEKPHAPGTSILLRLYWQARRDVACDYLVVVRLRDGTGRVAESAQDRPAHGRSATTGWRAGDVIEDRHLVPVDIRLPSGTYTLTIAMMDARSAQESEEVSIGAVQVQGRLHVFEPPSIAHPQAVSVGTAVRFLGYQVEPGPGERRVVTVRPGQAISLTLVWQCQAPLDTAYTVFTHLLDEKDNSIWGQQDSVPCQGQCPTTGWLPGEVLTDRYRIVVRPDTPPGTYRIEVGLYDPRTGARLVRADDQGDRILLDTMIEVRKP